MSACINETAPVALMGVLGPGEGQAWSMETFVVGRELPELQNEISGHPSHPGAMMFASQSGQSPDPGRGRMAVFCSAAAVVGPRAKAPPQFQSSHLPPIAEPRPTPRAASVLCFWPMGSGGGGRKAFCITSITLVQSQVEISIGAVSSMLKQHRNQEAGP